MQAIASSALADRVELIPAHNYEHVGSFISDLNALISMYNSGL